MYEKEAVILELKNGKQLALTVKEKQELKTYFRTDLADELIPIAIFFEKQVEIMTEELHRGGLGQGRGKEKAIEFHKILCRLIGEQRKTPGFSRGE